MGRGLEEIYHKVVFYGLDRLYTAPSAVLDLEGIDRHPLDITKLREGDHSFSIRDQVLVLKILFIKAYGGPAVI